MAQEQPDVLISSMARTPAREVLFHWIGELATYRTGFYKLSAAQGRLTHRIEL